jgi:branched-chain amino acid transport system substrate-binding protein
MFIGNFGNKVDMESKKKGSYAPTEKHKITNPKTTNPNNEGITRRQAIGKMGWAGVGIAAVAIVGVGGYIAYTETTSKSTTSSSTSSTSSATTSTPTSVTSSATGPSQVKLGAVLSLSGPFASFGQGIEFGQRQAIADLTSQGGINVNGTKLPVTYVVYDNASDPTKASSLAAQAILSDNVDMIVGGIEPPDTCNPISVAADRYSTPYLGNAGPWEPWWAGGPYTYAWSIGFRIVVEPTGFPTGYTCGDNYGGLTNQFKSQMNGNAAVLTCGDTDGTGWYGALPPVLKSAGYNVVSPQLYPVGTTDFTSIIETWKSAPCDILWGNLPAPDFGTFWRQSEELGYRPKIAVMGRAPLFYADINAWGDNLPLDVCTEVWWDPAWNFKGIGNATSQSLAGAWSAQTGAPINRDVGFGYAAVQIAADSITRAGTLDKVGVNTAIENTDGNFMAGPVKFFSATHDSPCPFVIAQWQAGTGSQPNWVQPVVYSLESPYPTTGQMSFPLPPWS